MQIWEKAIKFHDLGIVNFILFLTNFWDISNFWSRSSYSIILASVVVHCGEVYNTKGLSLQTICIILSTLLVKQRPLSLDTISLEGSGETSHHSSWSYLSFTLIKYVG